MEERQTVERALAIEREQTARIGALNNYNKEKVHKKQIAFHKNKCKNRWVFGGNRSGKTECGAVECLYMALGIHPYRENRKNVAGWVVSLSTQVQRDVAQKKVLHYLPKHAIVDIVMQTGRKGTPSRGIIPNCSAQRARRNKHNRLQVLRPRARKISRRITRFCLV